MEEMVDVIINIFASVFNGKLSSHTFKWMESRMGTGREKSYPL